jgi:hypothetical protein
MDLSGLLGAHSESASPDVLQTLVKTFADASMAAEADVLCGLAVAYRCHNGVETAVEHSRKVRLSCTARSVASRQRGEQP